SEEHTSELQSLTNLVCRLLLEKKKNEKSKPMRIRDTLVLDHPDATVGPRARGPHLRLAAASLTTTTLQSPSPTRQSTVTIHSVGPRPSTPLLSPNILLSYHHVTSSLAAVAWPTTLTPHLCAPLFSSSLRILSFL